MTARKPKPGSRWRVLVHGTDGRAHDITSNPDAPAKQAALAADLQQRRGADTPPYLGEPPIVLADTVFDEVAVDSWLHVEQMDTNRWWMSVAGLHINVRVGRNGKAQDVLVEMDDPQPGVSYRINANDHTPGGPS